MVIGSAGHNDGLSWAAGNVANLHSKSKQARICELQRLTVSVDRLQETKTKFLGQPIYVAIREVSRPDRKITLNMVEATQRLAYRNLRVREQPQLPRTTTDPVACMWSLVADSSLPFDTKHTCA